MKSFRSGFVAIIGRPNVGKSTFLNYLIQEKVSISSPKPQTTRDQIRGIYTTDDLQIVFIDTPGIHKAKHELGKVMNQAATDPLRDVDLVLWMIDATYDFKEGEHHVASLLAKVTTPIFLIVNKIDLVVDKNRLMTTIAKFHEAVKFEETYYISSKTGEYVPLLVEAIGHLMPEGPLYYPKEQITDQPESFMVAELIREKVLYLTQEEIPHSVAVVIESMKKDEDGLLHIEALIYVERDSQKKIIIGKNGLMMKEIGTQARKEINILLGVKTFLNIWVKVEKDWRNKKGQLKRMGYEPER
ncbi:MAG: GTPase Era [Bacilli bacterium]